MELWFCWSPTFFLPRIKVGSTLFAWNLKNAPLNLLHSNLRGWPAGAAYVQIPNTELRRIQRTWTKFVEPTGAQVTRQRVTPLADFQPWEAMTRNQTPHTAWIHRCKLTKVVLPSDVVIAQQITQKHVARSIWDSVLLTFDICLVLCLNHRNSRPSVHNPTPRFAAISCHAPSSPSLGQVLAEKTTWFLEKPSRSCPFSGFPALLLVVETAKAKQAPRSV